MAMLNGLLLEHLMYAGIKQPLIDNLRLELQACEDNAWQRIKDGSTLWKIFEYLVQGTLSLSMVNVSGETLCQLHASYRQTSAELKKRIHEEQQIPMTQQTLVADVERIKQVSFDKTSKSGFEVDAGVMQNDVIRYEVEQPRHHELLISTSDRHGEPGGKAVESSHDREPDLHAQCVRSDDALQIARVHGPLRRARSAPPSLHGTAPPSKKSTIVFITKASETHSSATPSSISDSVESVDRSVPPKILVGNSNGASDASAVNRLTDFMQLKHSGFPSRGSAHGLRDCRPCSFHFTWQRYPDRRPPCKMSVMCEYCHDGTHHDGWRSKFRKHRPPPKNKQILRMSL